MKKDYRILINDDRLEIVMKNKIIRLTLLDRQGVDVNSKILKQIFISKIVEGYDTLQLTQKPDFYEVIDSFYHDNMMIWGVKDAINIGIDEIEYEKVCNWYIDKIDKKEVE